MPTKAPPPIKVEIVGLEWLAKLVAELTWKIEQMAKTQDELIAQVTAQTAQIQKIGAETQSLIDKVKELIDLIAQGPVKPELQAAVDAVDAQLKVVDDLVPDQTEPPVEG